MISPDLLGKRFVRLVVVRKTNQSRSGSVVWECLCDCGNTCFVSTRHLNRKRGVVKSCGCLKEEKDSIRGKDSPYYRGHEGLSQKFFNDHVLRSSKGYEGVSNKRNPVDIDIDKEFLWNLFKLQNGKCKLSGLEITLPTHWRDGFYTASVDRIDSSKGYMKGNVQWVHKHINLMKNTFDNEYFIDMCKKICENNS